MPPKRRKTYLEPFCDKERLPRSTEYRQSRADRRAQTACNDSSLSDASDEAEPHAPSASRSPLNPSISDPENEPPASSSWFDSRRPPTEGVCEEYDPSDLLSEPDYDTAGRASFLDSDFTADDIATLVMDFAVTSGLSWTQIERLMKFVGFILKRNDLPDTKFLFKKFAGVSLDTLTFHYYCPDCMRLLGECEGATKKKDVDLTCIQCGMKHTQSALATHGNFFVSLPLEKQLSSVLSSKEVAKALKSSLERISQPRDTDLKSDITDGELYRQQREELDLDAMGITMTVSSDGCPLFNSSKYSIWPVQMAINELPPSQRCKNLMISMLWYGQTHPNMTIMLMAFVKQMRLLGDTGVKWTCDGKTFHSKVYCLNSVADSPARALMQNMVQYNGYFGCGWCLHPGESVEGTVKYPASASTFPDRSKDSVMMDMKEVHNTGVYKRGVKGPSPLINLPAFDIVWSFSPDYMHCVLLGVTRQVMELWLSNVGAPYYIGSPQLLQEIDERLCCIKPPQCIPRLPRSVQLRKYWKAVEWQQWLLYFGLVCLDGILPVRYLNHFSLLVKGTFLLLQDSVPSSDIAMSTDCLVQFVVGIQFLYGEKNMTSNVHQLLHLPKSVVLQGPLWAHSCFCFEASMGRLKGLISSAKGVPHQIMTRVMMAHTLNASKAVSSPCSGLFEEYHA
ncbi:uncharacterized protein LOC119399326 [Rhipicephalus sanguineus]|uniref:uncharacterized protein LOC119399326 n=1 Tax=Rhipicephalus sanguineus TaxID=34632 RepID=UPI0020C20492|nr:uncharacterized protein LOC119399326 [Rhipicephalus sanguineus]